MQSDERLSHPSRRQFGIGLMLAAAASTVPGRLFAEEATRPKYKICAFVKFLQKLDYEQLADEIAAAGFDGVEVPAREKEGYIHPAMAADELPKLQEALAKRNLEITILTTDILKVDQPHALKLFQTAAELKITRYRLGFYAYDLQQPILKQLAGWQPAIQEIAALNRDLGIAAVYQNHSGAGYMGATLWDLHSLIKGYPMSEIGCVFDVRHASVEAGEAWPQFYNLMKPHISAVSVKDYVWEGRKSQDVPLGKGRVDPKCFRLLEESGFDGPISVHVEYLPNGSAEENLQALKADLKTLKVLLST